MDKDKREIRKEGELGETNTGGSEGTPPPETKERRSSPTSYEELGRLGGEAVKERYGPEFYAEIGRKGGETVKRERGPAFYSEIGKKGGEARKEQLRGGHG